MGRSFDGDSNLPSDRRRFKWAVHSTATRIYPLIGEELNGPFFRRRFESAVCSAATGWAPIRWRLESAPGRRRFKWALHLTAIRICPPIGGDVRERCARDLRGDVRGIRKCRHRSVAPEEIVRGRLRSLAAGDDEMTNDRHRSLAAGVDRQRLLHVKSS